MSETKGWKRFFDGHAPEYEENVFTLNTKAEVEFLVEELALNAGTRVLDIGCGTGRHSVKLAQRGCEVTGVDLSSGMLDQARAAAAAAGVKVRWIEGDAARFVPDAEYDVVICLCEGAFGLLGRGENPIAQPLAILRATSQALKPGGKCLFTVLNGYSIVRRYSQEDVEAGRFDPLGLTEVSECDIEARTLFERGFVPTELVLLFGLAGLEVEAIWGGTAGSWGKRTIDLDEIEIMIKASKPEPGSPPKPWGMPESSKA